MHQRYVAMQNEPNKDLEADVHHYWQMIKEALQEFESEFQLEREPQQDQEREELRL